MNKNWIENQQKQYWNNKLKNNDLIRAVGSESIEHKILRYQQISNLFVDDKYFSILDVGAGVGDYYGYLSEQYPERGIKYLGLEVTENFCDIARQKYPAIVIDSLNILSEDNISIHDYVVLSGVFHQHGNVSIQEWEQYLEYMVIRSFELCSKGIAFNLLSNYVGFRREGNYYCSLVKIQELIVKNLSRFFTINHAYPLFEATFCVYKPEYIVGRFPQSEFNKYLKS